MVAALTGSLSPTSSDVSDSQPPISVGLSPEERSGPPLGGNMPGKYFPKWRTILRWVFVFVVIGLAAQAGRLLHLQIKARAVRVHGPIPYTVTLREIIHAPDGTTRVSREMTEAVRTDGSF